jgi:hypothetical protein
MVKVHTDKLFTNDKGQTNHGYYINDTLKTNLDILKEAVERKWDGVGLITGMEGSGKSTFVQMIAHYCDPTFSVERVVFSADDLMNAIDNAKKGQAIVFDEAIMNMSAQDFATQIQQILIKKFTLIRSKNLYIFLVIPSFFMLRRYFAVFRTKFLIHCYTPDAVSRGYFKFYSYTRKKDLYFRGAKMWNMKMIPPNFVGRFTNTFGYFVDVNEYNKKKADAVKSLAEDKDSPKQKYKEKYDDYKLKLQIEVKTFKEKWKDKFAEQKAKYKKDLAELKKQSITLQKSSDKKKIQELERKYYKFIHASYDIEKAHWQNSETEFHIGMYYDILKKYGAIDYTQATLKKYLEKGSEIVKIDSTH